MLYVLHEAAYRSAAPFSLAAHWARDFWRSPLNPAGETGLGRNLHASADLMANLTRRYGKPAWNIHQVTVNGQHVPVTCETVWESPWVKVRLFRRDQDAQAVSSARAERLPNKRVLRSDRGD